MSRQVDLGYDRNVTTLCVRNNILVLFLRVEAAFSASHLRAAPDLREVWPGFNFDAPALIITEMKVQDLHLVITDQVDVSFNVLDAEEMPGNIEHRAAPCVLRVI